MSKFPFAAVLPHPAAPHRTDPVALWLYVPRYTCFGFVVAERLCLRPGAGDGTRTRNLLITNQLLCQLSYASQKAIDRTVFLHTPADPSATGDREIPAYVYGNWGEVANQDLRASSNKKTAAAAETLSDATCPARGIRTR